MSPYATITTIYRVEVRVPEDVYRRFGHAPEYRRFVSRLDMPASGQDSYAEVIEWAEAPTRTACENFANEWHNQILRWQEQMRSEA